jgi:glycosyltransferase involved in cell wall biosynthesis
MEPPDRKSLIVPSQKFAVLCPVYNDWVSFAKLARAIDDLCRNMEGRICLFAVDDGSTIDCAPIRQIAPELTRLASVQLIHLVTNLGHQRAIAIGLSDIAARGAFDAAIVLDADGEDKPEDIFRLIALHLAHDRDIIIARRTKRSEGLRFRLLYGLYKALFQIMTGRYIGHGNFCLVPKRSIDYLTHMPTLWNHVAASVLRSRLPVRHIDTQRGVRYDGSSKMNLLSLVIHGLSAISVYVDVVLMRVFIMAIAMVIVCFAALAVILTMKFATALAIPGWATTASGIVFVMIFQNLILMGGALLFLLNSRNAPSFIPAFDGIRFIKSREDLRTRTGGTTEPVAAA